MNINREIDHTVIQDHWIAPAIDAVCSITEIGKGGDSSAIFSLKLDGGQIDPEHNEIIMHGEWEREAFTKLLKQILLEIELLDNK